MPNQKDYYEVLQVHPKARQEVIEAAYRRLARIHHPDKSADSDDAANANMVELNLAYEVLSDPQKRASYNRERASQMDPDTERYESQAATSSYVIRSEASQYVDRGISLAFRGDPDGAIREFGRAINLDSSCTEAYYRRGVLHWRFEEYDIAIKDLDMAINLEPGYAKAYAVRGLVYSEIEFEYSPQATLDLIKAIELDPKLADWKIDGLPLAYYLKWAYRESEDIAWEEPGQARRENQLLGKVAAILRKPLTIVAIGGLLTSIGLFIAISSAPMFTLLTMVGGIGIGVGVARLRSGNIQNKKQAWFLVIFAAIFLGVGLMNMVMSVPGPALLILCGAIFVGVGVAMFRVDERRF